jgi:hypothetical protein
VDGSCRNTPFTRLGTRGFRVDIEFNPIRKVNQVLLVTRYHKKFRYSVYLGYKIRTRQHGDKRFKSLPYYIRLIVRAYSQARSMRFIVFLITSADVTLEMLTLEFLLGETMKHEGGLCIDLQQ